MRRFARVVYALLTGLFTIGVLVQVFLAGLVVVARVTNWEGHVALGHGLGLPLILMLVSMYLGRLPRRIKRTTWILFGVYVFQADFVIFLRDSVPYAAAIHPVLALVDFALGWSLLRRALAEVSESAKLNETAAAALPAGD